MLRIQEEKRTRESGRGKAAPLLLLQHQRRDGLSTRENKGGMLEGDLDRIPVGTLAPTEDFVGLARVDPIFKPVEFPVKLLPLS